MSREYPALPAEYRASLQAFADEKGKNWKDELASVYWYNARIWSRYIDGKFSDDDGTRLHVIRNNYGPSWLFDVCDVKHTPKPKPAKKAK